MTNLFFIAHESGQLALCNETLLSLLKIKAGCLSRYKLDAFLDQSSVKWFKELNLHDPASDTLKSCELANVEISLPNNVSLVGNFKVSPLLNYRNERLALCEFTEQA